MSKEIVKTDHVAKEVERATLETSNRLKQIEEFLLGRDQRESPTESLEALILRATEAERLENAKAVCQLCKDQPETLHSHFVLGWAHFVAPATGGIDVHACAAAPIWDFDVPNDQTCAEPPEAGSTRPEMPTANELKALAALEQMVASARTHYSRNHDDSPPFPFEVVLSVTNYSILQSATKVVAEALRDRAASVQQEPSLSAELAKEEAAHLQTIDERDAAQEALQDTHIALGGDGEWCGKIPPETPPDSGDLKLDVPVLAAQVMQELLAFRKNAAPRTQGREPQIVRCKTCSGSVMFKPLESGEIEIYHDCPDSKKLAQARTQPSPKCPKCGSGEIKLCLTNANTYYVGCFTCDAKVFVFLWATGFPDLAQFFTALPEAQATDKKEPK